MSVIFPCFSNANPLRQYLLYELQVEICFIRERCDIGKGYIFYKLVNKFQTLDCYQVPMFVLQFFYWSKIFLIDIKISLFILHTKTFELLLIVGVFVSSLYYSITPTVKSYINDFLVNYEPFSSWRFLILQSDPIRRFSGVI